MRNQANRRRYEHVLILWCAGVPKAWIRDDLQTTDIFLSTLEPRERVSRGDNHGDKILDRLVILAYEGIISK